MDLFTHMMISYILSTVFGKAVGGISEPQLLFGVIAGMFPDFDMFTFPLWRKIPRLRHHGISHSLLFPVVNSVIMALIAFLIWGIDPLSLIPIGIISGVFHIVSDLVTNFPVPLLAPFSWKGFSLFIDSAINPYMLFPMPVIIVAFWQLRAQAYPYDVFVLFLACVSLWIIIHFLVKVAIKLHLNRRFKDLGDKVQAYPTFWWREWYMMRTETHGTTELTEYYDVKLGQDKAESRFFEVEGPPLKVEPPIDTKSKAVLYSHHALQDELERLNLLSFVVCSVSKEDDAWLVTWYDFWRRPRVRGVEIKIRVQPEGGLDKPHFP
jgi:membrane-bound metal-dependent hydrolase YbcI (DUF457 family)